MGARRHVYPRLSTIGSLVLCSVGCCMQCSGNLSYILVPHLLRIALTQRPSCCLLLCTGILLAVPVGVIAIPGTVDGSLLTRCVSSQHQSFTTVDTWWISVYGFLIPLLCVPGNCPPHTIYRMGWPNDLEHFFYYVGDNTRAPLRERLTQPATLAEGTI